MAYILKSALLIALIFSSLSAKDYGIHGEIYPILEEDLVEYIKEKTDPQKIEEFLSSYVEKLKSPKPVINLERAEKYNSFFFDPTTTITQDIKDHEGNLIASKGMKINPLHYVTLDEPLLFFDAEDPDQLNLVKEEGEAKWILVNGSPLDLEEKEGHPAYFDQKGDLSEKFGLKRVPSKITQQGSLLKIEEIPPRQEGFDA